MEVSQELARRRRSRRLWLAHRRCWSHWRCSPSTPAPAADVTLIGFFAIPPFIVAAGAGRRETAMPSSLCVVLALLAGIVDGFFGSFQHLFRVALGALAGLLAIRVAVMRERAELVSSLDRDVGRALAESRDVREADATVCSRPSRASSVGTPPRCGRWRGATPRSPACTRGRRPGHHSRSTRRRARLVDGGVGLPGRVLASGEPAWVADVREDPASPARTAARRPASVPRPPSRSRARAVCEV